MSQVFHNGEWVLLGKVELQHKINKDKMVRLMKRFKDNEIAILYNCSFNAIRDLRQKYELKTRIAFTRRSIEDYCEFIFRALGFKDEEKMKLQNEQRKQRRIKMKDVNKDGTDVRVTHYNVVLNEKQLRHILMGGVLVIQNGLPIRINVIASDIGYERIERIALDGMETSANMIGRTMIYTTEQEKSR